MNVMDWSHSSEIKELMCGNKQVVMQCGTMGCDVYSCGSVLVIAPPPE